VQRLRIEVREVSEGAAIEKVIFHIINAAFHFAFAARAIRLMGLDGEALVSGKVQKLRLQTGWARAALCFILS
jgi:hypothetical protein